MMMLILAVYLVVKSGTFSFGSEIPQDVLLKSHQGCRRAGRHRARLRR
jgi:hypothetical protein